MVAFAGKFNKATSELIALVQDNGGKVTTSITRKCTHFVTTAEEIARNSTKVLAATKHGVPMVNEEWIADSIKKEGKQKADKYLVTLTTSTDSKKSSSKQIADDDDSSDEEDEFNEEEKDEYDSKGFKDMRERFLKELSAMINDETYSDLVIIAAEEGEKEKSFFAHKAVICTHSAVMKNMVLKSEEKLNGKAVIRLKLKPLLCELMLDVMYCGRADPNPAHVFPLLSVCEQYGLETYASWLRISLWTTKNICLMYEEAVKKGKPEEISWCQRIIEKRTEKAFSSDTFTALSGASLLKLLESNRLRIDELTLFECLVEWADSQPDTETPNPNSNVDEEVLLQQKRKKLLAPVIGKVRFPLIKPDDLYRYVEPYKVVPEELLLEAYRYYATKNCDIDEIRTTPRGHSTRVKWLTYSHMRTLKNWLPKGYTVKTILFQADKDGFKNTTFHEKCNNKGPSLTVVFANDGYIFGGFTTKSWTSCGNYVSDTEAFIFTLSDGKNRPPTKLDFNSTGSYTTHSIYDYASYGPTFGGGHDLYVTLDSPTSSYSNLGYTYKLPTGVTQGTSGQSFLAGKYNQWTIKDCVVFGLK